MTSNLEQLEQLAADDPNSGVAHCRRLLASGPSVSESAAIRRILGLALARLDRVDEALEVLRAALADVPPASRDLRAKVATTLGGVLSWSGRHLEALHILDTADQAPSPILTARMLAQRGQVRYRIAEFDRAIVELADAERRLRVAGDVVWVAHTLVNQALCHAHLGHQRQAVECLEEALAIYQSSGASSYVAETYANLAWVSTLAGDTPSALEWFDRSEDEHRKLDMPLDQYWRDRADALTDANLGADALRYAQIAVDGLRSSGQVMGYIDALVTLTRAQMCAGDHAAALSTAREGVELSSTAGLSRWRSRFEQLGVSAAHVAGALTAADEARISDLATELATTGMLGPSAEARLTAAEMALQSGQPHRARKALDHIDASNPLLGLPTLARHHAVRAEIAATEGNRREAYAAARASIRVAARAGARTGAHELRAGIAAHATRAAALGLGLAIRHSRPRTMLRWAELSRFAASAALAPVVDHGLQNDLDSLRALTLELQEESSVDERASEDHHRRANLERQIRRRNRRVRPTGAASARALDLDLLRARLGDRTLVVFSEVEEKVHRIVATRSGVRTAFTAQVSQVATAVRHLRSVVRRAVLRSTRTGSVEPASLAAVDRAALALNELLFAGASIEHELVVVPPPGGFAVPWRLLPAVGDMAFTVAPSVGAWLRGVDYARPGSMLGAPGADLEWAHREIAAIATSYPSAAVMAAPQAIPAMLRAAADASVVHIAAHGDLRSDNPQFSSLRLESGPLHVYDVEQMPSQPSLWVLSACDAGLDTPRPGSTLLGFVGSLLAAGAHSVIAGVGLVADASETVAFMTAFHSAIVHGARPSQALATAHSTMDGASARLSGANLVCFGTG